MKIYAVAINLHDHNTYDGVYHNQLDFESFHLKVSVFDMVC